jgi:hypothetical protein
MFEDMIGLFRHPVYDTEKVYYHKKCNRFFKIYKITDDYYEISGLTEYYNDSMTNVVRSKVSYDFVKEAKEVKAIDKIANWNGIGWKVKEVD